MHHSGLLQRPAAISAPADIVERVPSMPPPSSVPSHATARLTGHCVCAGKSFRSVIRTMLHWAEIAANRMAETNRGLQYDRSPSFGTGSSLHALVVYLASPVLHKCKDSETFQKTATSGWGVAFEALWSSESLVSLVGLVWCEGMSPFPQVSPFC